MNEYKSEWMAHAHLLLPVLITRMDQDNNPRFEQAKHNVSSLGRLKLATRATTKAAAVGLALSAIDGPLPIMDVIGFGYWTIASGAAWINFFENF